MQYHMFKRFNITVPLIIIYLSGVINATPVAVDATKTYQTIDGFGACSAWISSKITASLANQFWLEDTVDGHVGLSILRVMIPCNGSYTTEMGAATQAIKINPQIIVWGAAWSPPGKFKTNNSCVGGSLNSDSASQKGYADYLIKFVQDVKSKYSIDIYAVSCQNEPDWMPSYDGCKWTGDQFKVFVRDYWGPACEAAGIKAKRMISESYSNSPAMSDPALKDAKAAKYVDIIGGHLYGGGPNPYPLADSLKKQYWETENSGMGGPDESITNGIMYANIVHKCLVKCNMNAYHYWWLVNNNNDDEGLCNKSGKPTPRMYTIGNFSKFIRPGFVRVDATAAPASGITASAYYGALYGRLVIVAINSGSAATQDFSITGFPDGTSAVPWLTDASHSLEKQTAVAISSNAFSYSLPSKSVTTFVIWDGKTQAPKVSVTTTPKHPVEKISLSRRAGVFKAAVPYADKSWTLQVILPSGKELFCKQVPAGCKTASFDVPGHYAGILLVRIEQGVRGWTSVVTQQ